MIYRNEICSGTIDLAAEKCKNVSRSSEEVAGSQERRRVWMLIIVFWFVFVIVNQTREICRSSISDELIRPG